MKASDIREMRAEELKDKLDDLQKQLYSLRTQSVTEKLEDICAKANVRKDIARLKTILREKELKGG